MQTVKEFKSIRNFLNAANIRVDSRFPDLLIVSWENLPDYFCLDTIPFRNHYFEITLTAKVSHSLKIDQFEFQDEGDKLFFISPYRLQSCIPNTDIPIQGFTILFHPEFIHLSTSSKFYSNGYPFFNHLNSPGLSLNETSKPEFLELFKKISDEYHQTGNIFSREIIKHYLYVLLLKGRQYYQQDNAPLAGSTREQEIYNRFIDLVQQHFTEWHTVGEYADHIHVSAKHLSETVKSISGQSALQIIHNTLIHHAKSLLRQTEMSIAEVAYELQFESPHYFAVFFKRHTGVSPTRFRYS